MANLGFIGIGIMGKPMASHLLEVTTHAAVA
jgi:3-hydroxyisobutyrate dehydrogenase-like beta-hydroxyacid dehydrogenase